MSGIEKKSGDVEKLIAVAVSKSGESEQEVISFYPDLLQFNQYINDISGSKNKIQPSFNFLTRTVVDADKEKLKSLILVGNVPNGIAVMNIVGVISEEMNGQVEFAIKK